MPRLLFGPADDPVFADRFLHDPMSTRRWATFSATTPSWEATIADAGGPPAALLVWPGYTSVPAWVWAAPVPVVALAHDPNLLWHAHRRLLTLADLVVADAPSADRLRRAGLGHVRAANLYGLDRHFLAELDRPDPDERDVDVLFVGNANPAVQGERLAWLGRLAALAPRRRVAIASGVFGGDYRALLRRAKVVFNRSVRGECNLRSLEAAATGAVLLQEAANAEVPRYLRPGVEFAEYTAEDLEAVVERLLADDAGRTRMAAAARERVRGYGFDALVETAVGVGGDGWDEVLEQARARAALPPAVPLVGRVWQRASRSVGPDADPALVADLTAAGDDSALAALAADPAAAERYFAAAAAGGDRPALVGRAVALAELGRPAEAVAAADVALTALAGGELTAAEADRVPYPLAFDWVRAGWERAAFDHQDDPADERAAKARLLRGRALAVKAGVTGRVEDAVAAADGCPDQPHLRALAGAALLAAGDPAAAADHLRAAVAGNPFDRPAADRLADALDRLGRADEAAQVREHRRRVDLATGRTPQPAPASAPAPPPPAAGGTRFVDLPAEQFAARFGRPDTSAALSGFTPPADTHAVLALVLALRPRRLLEVGTAAGHMAANLTAFSPPDAVVYSLGVVAEDDPRSGTPHQQYEVPARHQFARHLNHFGTAAKACLVTADSRTYDFARLPELDFAFVDGGHDYATARADSLAVYARLRPGGCLVWHDLPSPTPWVEVERAVSDVGFAEPVYRVAGTGVAFLLKGEGVPAAAGPDSGRVEVAWDGDVGRAHSLAWVNRAVCGELIARGQAVTLVPRGLSPVPAPPLPVPPDLAGRVGPAPAGAVVVRHQWPPDFTPPPGTGRFVVIQPWEFGRLPRAWVDPIVSTVDEVWVPSRSVLRAFVASGVPADRVAVVPNGVDPDRFRPGLDPLPLPTGKRVRLLFVGGTIPRKGFDLLLAAYRRAFAAADDVCLVVKESGAGTFYRDQTAGTQVAAAQADPAGPEVVYLSDELTEGELPRLYAACDALVHPYRGEGFALPVLEAMACGVPVAVTAGGPTDEFVPPAAGWRIPAELRYFDREAVGDLPTAGFPWWLEPDPDALVEVFREVVADAGGRAERGAAARRAALGWTWARAAAAVEDRVRVLRARTPVRFRTPPDAARVAGADEPALVPHAVRVDAGPSPAAATAEVVPAVAGRPRVSLTMIVRNEEHHLGECLASFRDLVDEAVVVDTGSTDRTREIAAKFGCRVGEFPWVDDFAAARNAALDLATGDYAFWADADDRADEANRAALRALFAALPAGNAAFVMSCLCVPDRPGGAETAVDHVRAFRRHPRHRWTYRVHEQILPALRGTGADVRWSGVAVRHVGYVDPAVRRRKLSRDLRLLELDLADRPGDPFTLFNLGSVRHEAGEYAAAADALERSLAGSHPRDSIVRKAYALLARCRRELGDATGADAALRRGRQHYPDDAELVFLAAGLAREGGDLRAAEGLYRKLVGGAEGPHFASVDTGLRGAKGLHNLALTVLDQGRTGEAAGLFRRAAAAEPGFLPPLAALGELASRAGDRGECLRIAQAMRGCGPDGEAEAARLLTAIGCVGPPP